MNPRSEDTAMTAREQMEEVSIQDDRDVTPAEVRRRVRRAIRQLQLVDEDLAILEARDRHDESVVEVSKRLGRIEAEVGIVSRKVHE